MSAPVEAGYAPVNGVEMYWERHGSGDGVPVVVVHGGFGLASMSGALCDRLAHGRPVVAVELQGHGHTRDIDRPFTYESFGDDVAGLIAHLDLGRADLVGYSLGGGVCLRAALQHPASVRRLAIVSFPYRREGWYPEIRAVFDELGRAGFERMRRYPTYSAWLEVSPDPDGFPALMDKTGALQRRPYDWGDEIAGLAAQTLLVFADADSIPLRHAAEFYALLGGGRGDAGWDASSRALAQLAVVPGRTHYDLFGSDEVAEVLDRFLA